MTIWGTASSSLHDEGAAANTDWFRWEERNRAPRSGAGNGLATNAADHFGALGAAGIAHHLMGVEWARLEPSPGKWAPDAVAYYRTLLQAARDAGVEPWVCLHNLSLPGWFLDEGSFSDDRARSYFWPRYVDLCAQSFGDLVGGWIPNWEPLSWAWNGFYTGVTPPGRSDSGAFTNALRGIHLAHRDAWRELRGAGAPVATAHPLGAVIAADESDEALQWRKRFEQLMWRTVVSAQRDGVLLIPGRADEEVPDLMDSCDIVGFTYRGGYVIDGGANLSPYPPGERRDMAGRTPWPEGFGDTLRRLDDQLNGRSLMLSSFAVGTDDDQWRCDVIEAHGQIVEEAVDDGIDVKAAFYWTAVDGYEPGTGFSVPYGVFDRDREPRRSASVLAAREQRGPDDQASDQETGI
ncbi:MAG: family 1 glycosylhydrolase [Acidimicrobiia bacterium]